MQSYLRNEYLTGGWRRKPAHSSLWLVSEPIFSNSERQNIDSEVAKDVACHKNMKSVKKYLGWLSFGSKPEYNRNPFLLKARNISAREKICVQSCESWWVGGDQEREEQLSGDRGEEGEQEWDDELCNLPSTKIPLWPPSGSFSNSRSPLPGLTLTISTTLLRERER